VNLRPRTQVWAVSGSFAGRSVAVASVVAVGKCLVFRQFFERLGAFALGDVQPLAQLVGRSKQIVPTLNCRFRGRRISEVTGIVYPAALLLGGHLVIKLMRHPLELGDHRLDLTDLATFLFSLESLRSHKTFTRFHLPAPLQSHRDGSTRPTPERRVSLPACVRLLTIHLRLAVIMTEAA